MSQLDYILKIMYENIKFCIESIVLFVLPLFTKSLFANIRFQFKRAI